MSSEPNPVNPEPGKQRSNKTVFISYSRSDSDFVNDLANWLRESGCAIWQDTSALRGGETWASGIDQAVRASDVIVVVLSPASTASEWVRKETLLALKLRKPVVPILIEDTEIPVQLVDIQVIDFRGDKEEAGQSLIKAIVNSAGATTVSYKPFRRQRYHTLLVASTLGVIVLAGIIYLATRRKEDPQFNNTSNTVQTTNTPTPSPTARTVPPWPTQEGVYVVDSSETIPPFPATLSGYKSDDGKDYWGDPTKTSSSIRVFEGGDWELIPNFPLAGNHCGEGMFMLRWRSGNPHIEIKSTLGPSPQQTSTDTKLGSFGYLLGTNCDQPMFRFSAAKNGDESTLADVHYEVKFWYAAP